MDNGELKEILKGISGFRDYYPEDFMDVKFILDIMKNVSEEFGYEEYEGPSLEYAKLIEIKSGQELMDETFTVIGKDERELVLRPEQTPTLARMIVNEQQRYPKPIRWYCIPRIFRNETPQKGRVREFFQFNADIIGIDHPSADAEIIALTTKIIKRAGLKDDEFVCVINSRELVQNYFNQLGIRNYIDIIKIIDGREKYLENYIFEDLKKKGIGIQQSQEIANNIRMILHQDPELEKDYSKLLQKPHYSEYLNSLSSLFREVLIKTFREKGLSEEQAEQLYRFSQIRGTPSDFFNKMKELDLNQEVQKSLKNLEKLSNYLSYNNVINNCKFDASIARGLDYYTGIVFEFLDKTGSVVRAIAGGGRYDQLVSTFGGEKLPATGIGMGETVLMTILDDLGRLDKYKQKTKVYVAPISKDVVKEATSITRIVREKYNTILNPFDWNLSKLITDASTREIPVLIIVGKRDLEKNQVTLRNLISGEQKQVLIENLVTEIATIT